MEETVKTTSILVDGLLAATGYTARVGPIKDLHKEQKVDHISHLQARGGLLRQTDLAMARDLKWLHHSQQEKHFAESRDCHMEQEHGTST